jgi:signal transduction histidine kinase
MEKETILVKNNFKKKEGDFDESINLLDPLRVLFIEDNPGDTRLILEMFKQIEERFEIICKQDLKEGIKSFYSASFDLILLDLTLPDSYGLDTLLKMLKIAQNIPIVVLTGTDDEYLAIKAVKAGAQDYLIKGKVDEVLLKRSIYYAIERHRIKEKLKKSEAKYKKAYNRANFYKDLFAHDMNNILQNVLSSMELIDVNLTKFNNIEEAKDLLIILGDQVRRGAMLITNVRKLSIVEDSNKKLHPVELRIVLEKSIRNLKSNFKEKNIKIDINYSDGDLFVLGDDLLDDVFKVILTNAITHNKNSIKEVSISISKVREFGEEAFIRMEFIDNGVGIEDIRKNSIFIRNINEAKNLCGIGLGLSLVKKIIERYEGKIWVEDRVKGDHTKGSKFVVNLPFYSQN